MDIAGGFLAAAALSLDPADNDNVKAVSCAVLELPGNAHYARGLLGCIPWQGLLVFAPFALFIGIIVQLFWQDKHITESD
jgi:hypothetical protein